PVTGGRRHPRRSMRRAGNGPLRRPAPCLECSLSQFTPYPEACDTAVGVDVEADLLDRLLGVHDEEVAGVGLQAGLRDEYGTTRKRGVPGDRRPPGCVAEEVRRVDFDAPHGAATGESDGDVV